MKRNKSAMDKVLMYLFTFRISFIINFMILILIVFASQITFNTDPKDHDKILTLSQNVKTFYTFYFASLRYSVTKYEDHEEVFCKIHQVLECVVV